MSERVERWYPVVGAAGASAVYVILLWGEPLPKRSGDLIAATISVAAIAVGFLGTAQSILLSMPNRRIVRQLQDIGRFKLVRHYVTRAIEWTCSCSSRSRFG